MLIRFFRPTHPRDLPRNVPAIDRSTSKLYIHGNTKSLQSMVHIYTCVYICYIYRECMERPVWLLILQLEKKSEKQTQWLTNIDLYGPLRLQNDTDSTLYVLRNQRWSRKKQFESKEWKTFKSVNQTVTVFIRRKFIETKRGRRYGLGRVVAAFCREKSFPPCQKSRNAKSE